MLLSFLRSSFVICFSALTVLLLPSSVSGQSSNSGGITLTNLYDAFGNESKVLKQDFGFSCLIEYRGKTILFDAGTDTKIFQDNLKGLNIDLKKVDIAILSHGHYDHMGGMDYLVSINPKVKIFLPNDFFSLGAPVKFPFKEAEPRAADSLSANERYFRGEKVVDGMVTVPTGRFSKANVEYITDSKEILPGIRLIATTSELMGTFIKYPPFDKNPQFIGMPELSVSFGSPEGQVIIAGCSHSTIEVIVRRAKELDSNKVRLVTGGFHLIPYDRKYIEGLAQRMKDQYNVTAVAPAHCTGHLGFSIFKKVFTDQYKFFGLGETVKL